MRRGAVVLVFALAAAACGAGGADPVFPGGDGTTSTPSGASTDSTASGSSEASASSVAAESEIGVTALAEGFIGDADEPATPTPEVRVGGTPNRRAAAAITDEVDAAGADLTGVEFWVFPVAASDEVLLVLEIDESAEQLLEDPAGQALLEVVARSEAPTEAGVTRFVMNYRGSDDQGPFVLTATIGWETLVSGIVDGVDTGEEMRLQMTRAGEVVGG